jgi:copper chaperone CopZ
MKTTKTIAAFALVALMLAGASTEVKAQKGTEKTVVIEASMTCDNCKKKIERDIAFEKGVKSVEANVETKKVTIRFDSSKNSEEKLVKAVEKLGYTAKIHETGKLMKVDSREDVPTKADGCCGKK